MILININYISRDDKIKGTNMVDNMQKWVWVKTCNFIIGNKNGLIRLVSHLFRIVVFHYFVIQNDLFLNRWKLWNPWYLLQMNLYLFFFSFFRQWILTFTIGVYFYMLITSYIQRDKWSCEKKCYSEKRNNEVGFLITFNLISIDVQLRLILRWWWSLLTLLP